MRTIITLVGFEYKKIFMRKIAVVALVIGLLTILVTQFTIFWIEGYENKTVYEDIITERAYARALSGRVIDEELLLATRDAFAGVPILQQRLTSIYYYQLFETDEYQRYARQYMDVSRIMYLVYDVDFNTIIDLTDDELRDFYQIRHQEVVQKINTRNISENAKAELIQLDASIETPWTFEYIGGYSTFIEQMYMLVYIIMLVIAICLAPMFSEEYSIGISQLILSSEYGKNKLVAAKLITGVSFSVALCLFTTFLTFLISLAIYGPDGAYAPSQLFFLDGFMIYPLNMLQLALIYSLCVLAAVIFVSAIILFLSSVFKSPFGVMIITTVFLMSPLFFVPSGNNNLVFNLYRLLPTTTMHAWTLFTDLPYDFGSFIVLPFVFLPVFFILASAVLLFFASRKFAGYQAG